jgi:hypothetical protein
MRYKYVPAVVGQELRLPLKETVREVDGRKKLCKPTGSALDGSADYHPGTIGVRWTWVRVEYDKNVPFRES